MSLLKPTPGEVMDRISILALKIKAYQKAGRNDSDLLSESRELHIYLSNFRASPVSRKYLQELEERISSINRRLWKAEDEVRSKLKPEKLLKVAKQIARLNDARSITIREINQAFRTKTIEEKIYG